MITWGELCAQRPDVAESEAGEIIDCGFLYEHEDGMTVEFMDDGSSPAKEEP